MSERKPPAPPADADLEARVAALESQMGHVGLGLAALDQRVDMLEDAATQPPPYPDQGLPEPPVRPSHELPPVEPPVEPPEPATGLLTIELALPDGPLTFAEADAVDLGDYVGEFVQQRCLLVRNGAWAVFFRPDADQSHLEVVVEYGGWDFSVSPPTPLVTPAHVSAYTAIIRMGEESLATIDVPAHYWLTRWRWQSAPRPVVRTAADLVAMKATLPLDEAALWNNPASHTRAVTWSGPMGTAGLTTAMGTTGDRQEIGPLTDRAGVLPAARQRRGARSHAGAGRGRRQLPVLGARPGDECAARHLRASQPRHKKQRRCRQVPGTEPGAGPARRRLFPTRQRHFPSVAYVPWLLTDDPYFLEGAQATALFGVIENNYNRINEKLPGLCLPVAKARLGVGFARHLSDGLVRADASAVMVAAALVVREHGRRQSRHTVERGMASQIKASRDLQHGAAAKRGDCAMAGGLSGCRVLGWVRWTRRPP